MDTEKKENTSPDVIGELFVAWLLLVAGSVIGKLVYAPFGCILFMTAGVYTVLLIIFLILVLFCSTFARIDAEHRGEQPANEEEISAHGYIIYFAVAYILFWILMFIIFPEDTGTGEFIRQWK